jgi:hypothetical protein
MARVYRLKDPSVIEKIITFRGKNRAIIPVLDGNGDLIIGQQVIDDPAYADLIPRILPLLEEIDYIKPPEDEREFETFIQSLGEKVPKTNLKTREVEYDGQVITVRSNEEGDESTKRERVRSEIKNETNIIGRAINGVVSAGRTAINWMTGLFQ